MSAATRGSRERLQECSPQKVREGVSSISGVSLLGHSPSKLTVGKNLSPGVRLRGRNVPSLCAYRWQGMAAYGQSEYRERRSCSS